MEYKGFLTEITYNKATNEFNGKVLGASQNLEFQGKSIYELDRNLKQVVNDYIAKCESKGTDPYRAYTGNIILRLSKDVHREVVTAAEREGVSVNKWMEAACKEKIKARK